MIVDDILRDCTLVNDQTHVVILDHGRVPIASGNWFQDHILSYSGSEVLDFNYDGLRNRIRIRTREVDPW